MSGQRLHNGITLPAEWPPRAMDPASDEPMPYLDNPPPVIPIDVGRQLFVDDFLIAETTLERVFHHPRKHEGNPVFQPATPSETEGVHPAAVPKGGGVWWDPADRCFKMWYEAGWLGHMAYAVSADGLTWERPALDVEPPTNRLLPEFRPDSGTVFIDFESRDPAQRFKMLLREPQEQIGGALEGPGNCLVSADGIHWSAPVKTGRMGDRSTMFYNPFRKVWVHSIRSYESGRCRAPIASIRIFSGARPGRMRSGCSGAGRTALTYQIQPSTRRRNSTIWTRLPTKASCSDCLRSTWVQRTRCARSKDGPKSPISRRPSAVTAFIGTGRTGRRSFPPPGGRAYGTAGMCNPSAGCA